MDPDRENCLSNLEHGPVAALDDPTAWELFSALRDEVGVEIQLQIYLTNRPESSPKTPQHTRKPDRLPILVANIYGSTDLFEDVGNFLQENDRYLQDPKGCDRNVPYRNPHTMTGLDAVPQWTSRFDSPLNECEKIKHTTGLLDGLQTEEVLLESETPPALKTTLYR